MRVLSILVVIFSIGVLIFCGRENTPVQALDNSQSLTANNASLASCKFYRNDQTADTGSCPPSDQGFRCEQALGYQSPLLLSYIDKASQITGVPPAVLAGLVRIESTVSEKNSVTGKSYSISDYTDSDVQQMTEFAKRADSSNIDETVPGTNKALCPRSKTGALGLTQIQPKGTRGNDGPAVNRGASFLSKIGKSGNNDSLTLADYCDPQTSLVLAGGFILAKLGLKEWINLPDPADNETLITKLAERYYGNDEQTGQYSNSLWRSVSECKAVAGGTAAVNASSSATLTGGGSGKSNKVCVKVGNPTEPNPCAGSPGGGGGGLNQGIVDWALQITNNLTKGGSLFDKLPNAVTNGSYSTGTCPSNCVQNIYWCTYLIIDAYNLAGNSTLPRDLAAVLSMKAYFANTPGFTLLSSDTRVEQLQPGDVVFFEGSGDQHVSLIKSVDIDENGNGAIHTYDSNNVVTEDIISVVNHTAQKAQTTARLYSITGFGRAVK